MILVWWGEKEEEGWYHIWDVDKGRLLQSFRSSFRGLRDMKILGDGSKILGLYGGQVEVVSMQTGEITSHLKTKGMNVFRLWVRGSQVAIDPLFRQGWDFGGWKVYFGDLSNQFRLGLAETALDRRGCNYVDRIVDTVTGRRVFHLPERYIHGSMKVLWDGQYLLIWSLSGEVVVVDFTYVLQTLPTAVSGVFSRLAS